MRMRASARSTPRRRARCRGVLAVLTGADAAGRRAEADPAPADAARPARHRAAQPRRLRRTSPRRTTRCPPTRCASSARRWRWWSPRRIAAAKDAAERVAVDYEPLPAVTATRWPRPQPGAPPLLRGRRRTSASTPRSATPPRPRRRSRAPRTWCRSTPGCSASPACRWSRAPRSATTTRRRGRYTLHAGSGGVVRQKAELAGMLGVPADDGARRSRATSAAISAPATRSIPEFALVALGGAARRPPGEMDLRARARRSSATIRAATSSVEAELALDAEGRFLGAARLATSAMSAPTP